MQASELKIKATPLTNNVCSFQFSLPLFADVDAYCDSAAKAQGSKLLSKLFAIRGISEVLIRQGEIKVKKSIDEPWPELAKQIGATIRELISNNQGEQMVTELKQAPPTKTSPSENLSETQAQELAQIQDALEHQVLPSLAQHGGSVTVERYQDGVLYLRFSGGCQGCSQVNTTVRHGIESMLKQKFTFIQGVEDVTEHSLGDNPYFN